MRQRTTRIALALGLVAGAPALLAAQSTDTLLVLEIPLELRTLSPEVSRVFVECPLVYNAPTGNVDTVAIVRTEEVRPTPTRFGGHLQDRLVTAVTTNDVRGVARGPDYGLQCFLFLVGPDGKGVRPWGFEQVADGPEWARITGPTIPPGRDDSRTLSAGNVDGTFGGLDVNYLSHDWGEQMYAAWLAAAGANRSDAPPGESSP